MDVQVAESGPCRRTLQIKVPPEQIKGHLDRAFANAARQVRMKGFRSGQVPRKVLEKRFGEAIRAEAKEQILNESFQSALRDHRLSVVGRPTIEGVDDSPVDEAAGFEFTVHFDVRPEFELGELRGIEIDAQPTEVTDEEVESACRQLADQKKTLEPIDAPVEESDFVKADLSFRDESGAEVHRRDGAQLNANIPIAGTDPELFKSQLVGKEKGQELTLELTFPERFDVEAVRGKPGTVHATIREIQRVQPAPIDDELAKGFEFDSLDALRAELRTRIGEEKQRAEKARREGAILEILANEHRFDLPESMVEDQLEHSLKQYRQQLDQAKIPEEEAVQKVDEARGEARTDAERRVRFFFLLEAIARKEGITVDEDDVEAEVAEIAARQNVQRDDVLAFYRERNLLSELRLGILERKVRDFLRENAKITDTRSESA